MNDFIYSDTNVDTNQNAHFKAIDIMTTTKLWLADTQEEIVAAFSYKEPPRITRSARSARVEEAKKNLQRLFFETIQRKERNSTRKGYAALQNFLSTNRTEKI